MGITDALAWLFQSPADRKIKQDDDPLEFYPPHTLKNELLRNDRPAGDPCLPHDADRVFQFGSFHPVTCATAGAFMSMPMASGCMSFGYNQPLSFPVFSPAPVEKRCKGCGRLQDSTRTDCVSCGKPY